MKNRRIGNCISNDGRIAFNSYGVCYTVGERVGHQDKNAKLAIIQSFEFDFKMNEVRVNTDKGYCYIDFLEKA